MGAPMEAADTVQKMPKTTAMTEPRAPMADGPRPGLMCFTAGLPPSAFLSPVVHGQLQHVRPGVVAAAVEFHPAPGHLGQVQIRTDDGLPVPDGLGHIVAVGIHHAAAAPADDIRQAADLLRAVEPGGVHVPSEDHVAVDEKAVPLDGNVTDGGLPLLVVVGVGKEFPHRGNKGFP